ncbi:exonuclease 1-like [Limulus polyphemus]|uniref:Exonuclease 1 n=1 Tax=Limulus polyphemus TaxID=6850 RepID=A0ABM1BN33_LIMPO|nr:exonuclease 1-like [Limulus polyphemus]
MGIQGLLPFLRKASREVNVNVFAGVTAGVDAYCWLHKGAFSCAEKLVKGEKTDGYVLYCMKMVNLLLGAGIKPVLVFDGRHLPSKKVTEQKRRENREKSRKKAKEYLREGKLKEARECFQRSVDVTSEMAHELIKACRQKGVDCIVAPYEADAQLAYLNKIGIVQIVITEDSDLILFGCEKILFKMDTGGRGILVEKTKIPVSMGNHAESFTFDKFRYMCILSGCDYLPSLPGIGLAKSCKFFSLTTNPNLEMVLPKVPTYLKMPNLEVSSIYKENFIKANNTFLYQLVFCPLQRRLVPLNPYPKDIEPETLTYAGEYFDDALQFALGNLHVHTMKPVDNFNPDKAKIPKSMTWSGKENSMLRLSIWDKNYKVSESSEEKLQYVSRIPSTHGKELALRTDQVLHSITPKKRTRENKVLVPVNTAPSDEELFSMYMSPSPHSAKKCKVESNDPSAVPQVIAETPEKPKSILNKFKVCGNKLTSTPVVRSRFFFKSPPQENTTVHKNEHSEVSWLDEIDKQYNSLQIDLPTASQQPGKEVVNGENVNMDGDDPESETTANFGSTRNRKQKTSFQDEIETSLDDSLLSSSGRDSRSFQWKRDKLQTLFSFQKKNSSLCLQSSPASQSSYKPIHPLEENSDGSQGSSPLTNCSIDQESFHLSQDSGKLSESQPCTSFLDDEELSPLSSTPISHESSSPSEVAQLTDALVSTATQKNRYFTGNKRETGKCRRMGLSKKPAETTTGTKKQLSLKESLFKFQFERKKQVFKSVVQHPSS